MVEYLKGRPDLCVYQVEDIVRNDFLWSDDHMMMHPATQQPYAHSVPGDFLWSPMTTDCNSSWDITTVEDIQHQTEDTGFLSPVKRRKMLEKDSDYSTLLGRDKRGNEFWANGIGLDDVANAFCDNSLSCTLGDILIPLDDLEFFKNIDGKVSNDFLCYGLPEMGNFEGADKMFRNCVSTYGVEAGKEVELGRFEHGELEKSGLKPTNPDSNKVDSSLGNHNSSKNHSTICSSFLSVATNNSGYSWTSEKPDSISLVEGPSLEDSTDVIITKEQISVQEFSYFMNQHIEEDTSSPSTCNWIDAVEIDPIKSAVEFGDHGLNPSSPIHSPYQDVDLSKGDPPKKYSEKPSSSKTLENTKMNHSATLEADYFHQLQILLKKLDVHTRQRIRDSLCRLAHDAEQRRNEANQNSHFGDQEDTYATMTEEANSYMTFETDTNAVDRAVTDLLFSSAI